MSMFLGPIHYMMFNKIKIAAGRSAAVISTFEKKYPAETGETVQAALPDGVVDFSGAVLEEILGDSPIHGFLQSLIDKVEISEASLVTALLYRFPDDANELLMDAFRSHGAETASAVQAESPGQSVENMLMQHYLEGMPCDQVSSYRTDGNGSTIVEHSDCVHKNKWESAGAPFETMCELLDAWVEGFAAALAPGVKLERTEAISKGASQCSCKLTQARLAAGTN
ncbi:MAG: L-2-amino-thiazoline-4-carboxylic acid hydrolase [Nitrospinota bacterium]